MDYQQTARAVLDAGCAGAVKLWGVSVKAMASDTDALQFDSAVRTGGIEYMRTAVALGSNIGDRLENLQAARNSILDVANVEAPILSSAVYETEPVGCEPGAGKFFNAVVEFGYADDPARLLEQLIEIEEALGRKRDHP